MVGRESVNQYKDYFESDKDEYEDLVLPVNAQAFSAYFENWQIGHQDKSTLKTFPMPEWNNELGWWANSINILREVNTIPDKVSEIEGQHTENLLSQSSLVNKEK